MILPPRMPIPDFDRNIQVPIEAESAFAAAHAKGFNDALDAVEAANMKPDGHYWDPTSPAYREMLATVPPAPSAPGPAA